MVKTFVNIDTSTCQVCKTVDAEAPGDAFLKPALRVWPAVQVLARMTTVIANIWFWAQAAFEGVADCVAGAVIAFLARHNSNAPNSRIGIGDGSFGANTGERALRVLA